MALIELRFDTPVGVIDGKVRYDAELVSIREDGVVRDPLKPATWASAQVSFKAKGWTLVKFAKSWVRGTPKGHVAHFYKAVPPTRVVLASPNLHEDQSGEGARGPLWTG